MDSQVQHVIDDSFADVSGEPAVKYLTSSTQGAREYRVPCTGSVKNSTNPGKISFNVKLNPNECLDRTLMVEYTIQVQIESKDVNKKIMKDNGLSLGCYPLNRVCTDLNVKLNNNSKSCNPSEFVSAFSHTNDSAEYRRMQTFPSQPDNFNTISSMAYGSGVRITEADGLISTGASNGTSILDLGQTNSESPFSVRSDSYGGNRAAFPVASIDHAGGSGGSKHTQLRKYVVTEPLLHPFLRTSDYRSVLARISDLSVDITLASLNGMFTIAQDLLKSEKDTRELAQADITADSIKLVDEPRLVYRVYQPTVSIPQVLSFDFMDMVTLRESLGPLTTIKFSEFAYNSRTYSLSQIPTRLLIFAKPRNAPTDTERADAFLAINSLTIRTGADSGALSGASPAQLYQMSARNGLNMPYGKFVRDLGSVVIVDLSKGDLGGFVPGVRTNFDFDISLKLQNTQFVVPTISGNFFTQATDPIDKDFDLFIIAQMESKLILDGNMASIIGGESVDLMKQVLADRPLTLVGDSKVGGAVRLGGKSGWHKFTNFLSNAAKTIAPVISTALQAKQLLGRGEYDGAGIRSGGALRVLG